MIDVDVGVATAVDLVVGPPDSLTFAFLQNQGTPFAGAYQLRTGTDSAGLPNLNLLLPASSLVGYSGGSLASLNNPVGGFASGIFISSTQGVALTNGSRTAVPESSSLALCSLGAIGSHVVGVIPPEPLPVSRSLPKAGPFNVLVGRVPRAVEDLVAQSGWDAAKILAIGVSAPPNHPWRGW